MRRLPTLALLIPLAAPGPVAAHEIHVSSKVLAANPYTPYAFLIGDWAVSDGKGGAPFVTLKFHWAANQAYILTGAYVGDRPHFEGMLMWNGVHHNLDALIATDMDHGLAQERGTVSIVDGAVVRDSIASYSAGVSAGGPLAGPDGAASATRQSMKRIDADHVAISFMVEAKDGWEPIMPGGDHLLMTRIK